ncbi:MAG TPA: AAA family ATPase [Spirochaetia bacterium]|nr:AAA family ATPase [Spirochaetia bacterium]
MGDSASPVRPTLDFSASHALSRRLIEGLSTVIRGKRTVLEYLVTCILAGGHLLIEDVPGLGKTTLAKTVARLVSRSRKGSHVVFRRIQFTPDLLPYDITGVDVFDPSNGTFVFSPGPVFTNVLLADEINRTTPKVQSALLEVMAEGQVTIGNKTHRLDPFFFVMATQNPVEMEGVYPLPIAQIDRFLMKLRVGYPEPDVEVEIVRDDPSHTVMPEIQAVCGREEILGARDAVGRVFCDEKLIRAGVGISAATRGHPGIALGSSPRGSLMLIRAARALALVRGREYVVDQDLIDLAPLVIAHRLRLKDSRLDPQTMAREITMSQLSHIPY